jgi:hypothetical protein
MVICISSVFSCQVSLPSGKGGLGRQLFETVSMAEPRFLSAIYLFLSATKEIGQYPHARFDRQRRVGNVTNALTFGGKSQAQKMDRWNTVVSIS